MIARLIEGVPRRACVLLGLLLAASVFAPRRPPPLCLFNAQSLGGGRQQLAGRGGFGRDLFMGAENVGVVLHQAAHPHDAVQ